MDKGCGRGSSLGRPFANSTSDIRPMFAIGSGNDEDVLVCFCEVVLGSKHPVTSTERFGGSCVN
jgi:hypothetical protein